MRPPGTRLTVVVNRSPTSGELDIEYDRTTDSPAIVARNVQNWPGRVGERVLELGRDVEDERPGVGGLVDDIDHRAAGGTRGRAASVVPRSAGSRTMITPLSRVVSRRSRPVGGCGVSRNDEKWPPDGAGRAPRALLAAEWWTDDTLGALVDRSPARRARRDRQRLVGVAPVARHLRRRARRRAAARQRARRRGGRAGRGRRVPTAELAGGGRRVLRARDRRLRARADRAHLRPQGGALHPRPRVTRARTSPPTVSATSTTSTSSTARARTSSPISSCTSCRAALSKRRRGHRRGTAARVRRVALGRRHDAAAPAEAVAAADPDDVCVLAYTSGTTSDPKGVMHSHRTLLAELLHMRAWISPRHRPT